MNAANHPPNPQTLTLKKKDMHGIYTISPQNGIRKRLLREQKQRSFRQKAPADMWNRFSVSFDVLSGEMGID